MTVDVGAGAIGPSISSRTAEFHWGDEFAPGGRQMANTWQGFPHENARVDDCERTSPVTAFPRNGYGIHDMIGNVWEWTMDWVRRLRPPSRRTRSPSPEETEAEPP